MNPVIWLFRTLGDEWKNWKWNGRAKPGLPNQQVWYKRPAWLSSSLAFTPWAALNAFGQHYGRAESRVHLTAPIRPMTVAPPRGLSYRLDYLRDSCNIQMTGGEAMGLSQASCDSPGNAVLLTQPGSRSRCLVNCGLMRAWRMVSGF